MKTFLILILVLCFNSYETRPYNKLRKCENCYWYVKGNNVKNGMCKLFTDKIGYNLASECRENQLMCGFNGWFYDDVNKYYKNSILSSSDENNNENNYEKNIEVFRNKLD